MDNADPKLLDGEITVTVPYAIGRQRLSDLLCSAVEGGTGYWAQVDQIVRTPNLDYVSVRFHEIESSEPGARNKKVKVIDIDSLAHGVQRCALSKRYAHHFRDFITDNDDAITADVMVQFVMFGDVIYG